MSLADEITEFVREHFETPGRHLQLETDLVSEFASTDPDWFADFLESVSKRFGIRHRKLGFARSLLGKVYTEVICVEHLTIVQLCEIVEAGAWPETFIKPRSALGKN